MKIRTKFYESNKGKINITNTTKDLKLFSNSIVYECSIFPKISRINPQKV